MEKNQNAYQLSAISLGAISLNMLTYITTPFDVVGCRYGDITEQAVRVLLENITHVDENIATSHLVRAIYVQKGFIKEAPSC